MEKTIKTLEIARKTITVLMIISAVLIAVICFYLYTLFFETKYIELILIPIASIINTCIIGMSAVINGHISVAINTIEEDKLKAAKFEIKVNNLDADRIIAAWQPIVDRTIKPPKNQGRSINN